ncbi:MAG: hypothetical protein KJZ73_13075 [Pseudorhodoplanes sp.]|nr:hypothetical protein [Pseudorhodoplanes sp.]
MAQQFRNWLRTLGAPEDPVATNTTDEWSAMSLLKAIYQKISDGSFAAAVASSADGVIKIAVAGAVAQVNLAAKRAQRITAGASASAAQAEAFRGALAGFVAQCAHYLRLTRASRSAAAASALAAGTSETNAAGSEANASGYALVAQQAVNFSAGAALYGQRAKKDRDAAMAAKVAAEAAAASVPAAETLVLPVQVYS